jgi:hypothetical protein
MQPSVWAWPWVRRPPALPPPRTTTHEGAEEATGPEEAHASALGEQAGLAWGKVG